MLSTQEIPLESIANLGGNALIGVAFMWILFRVFPSFLARLDKVIEDGQKRDDSRLQMFLALHRENREEDSRRRHDERDKIQEAFLTFSKAQTEELKELADAVKTLSETIREQGVR